MSLQQQLQSSLQNHDRRICKTRHRASRQPFTASLSRPTHRRDLSAQKATHIPKLPASSVAVRASALLTQLKTSTADNATTLPALSPLDANYEATHAFSDYSNWLIPGSVMLGRYPYVEPSRCRSRDQGEEQVLQILKAGITTFISLQAELAPQSQLRLSGSQGFLPYKATAELIRSSLKGPPPMESLGTLRNPTLDKFLPPRRRRGSSPPPPIASEPELQFLHYPIVDLGLPSVSLLQTLLTDIEQRLGAGERMYIHCWGGRGRAGTVGACLLGSAYGVDEEEALQRVQRAFATRGDALYRSPETDEQHSFVRTYIQSLRQ